MGGLTIFINRGKTLQLLHIWRVSTIELVYASRMFEELAEAIENLVVPAEGGALAEVFRLHGRLGAKATMAAAAFDAAGHWELDGSASMAAWMRVRLRLTNQQANRILKNARRVRSLTATAEAWEAGRLSTGQIEVIVDNVTERRAFLFGEHEAGVVPGLEALDIIQTVRAMQDWAARADAVLDEPEPPEEPPAKLQLAKTLDGRGYLNGSFDAAGIDVIATGLRLAECSDVPGEPRRPVAERQGQAMVDVFGWYLDHQADKLGKRHRPHVNVVIDHRDLLDNGPGRTLEGLALDAATLHRLLCDANIHRVISDGASSILDYGRATRTIPPAVYSSLVLRDMGCRFPGCDRKPEWCEGHHVWHWEDGGPTDMGNLVLLCSRHHHRVHLPGWQLKLRPDATVGVTNPDGLTTTSDPPLLC